MTLTASAVLASLILTNSFLCVEKDNEGIRLTRRGENAPFATWPLTKTKDVAWSVELPTDRPFAYVHIAPATKAADWRPKTMTMPEIKLRRFTHRPVAHGSDGLRTTDAAAPSCGYIAIAEPTNRCGVVAAWLTNERASGAFASRTLPDGNIALAPIADYGPMTVRANKTPPGDIIVVGAFDDCRLGLEAWADAVAAHYRIALSKNRTGYCTWCSNRYGYSDRSRFSRGCGAGTEESTRAYADAAARQLKKYCFDFIQFDDQWQAGNENNGPARDFAHVNPKGGYPNGFRNTVNHLNSRGIDAGLWFIPFGGDAKDPTWANASNLYVRSAVSIDKSDSGNAFKRPIALARKKGDPIKTIWGGECLDMTRPEARQRLADYVHRFTFDWGMRYLKCDGVFTAMGGDLYGGYAWADVGFARAQFADPEASNVSAYRLGWQTMRHAAAPGTFLLGCNLGTIRAMVPSFGLVDAMRIGNDNGPIDDYPERYLEGPLAGSMRYFLNGRVWWNDPDSTYVRKETSLARAQKMASWTALTDSLFEVGDWLPDLPEERIEILRRTLAHHGCRNVRPIDFFESAIPNGWLLNGGSAKVLGLFNWQTNATLKIDWSLAYAGLDSTKTYVGYDFWNHSLIQPFSNRITLEVPPDGVRIISLAEVSDSPRIISTSLHVAAPVYGVNGTRVLTIKGEPLVVRSYSRAGGLVEHTVPAGNGGWVDMNAATHFTLKKGESRVIDLGPDGEGGYPKVSFSSTQGAAKVRLSYATHPDGLGPKGDFWHETRANYMGDHLWLPILPANTDRFDTFVQNGSGVWRAQLAQGLVRYVKVTVEDGEATIDNIELVNDGIHSTEMRVGSFECSDERINGVWKASVRTCELAAIPARTKPIAVAGIHTNAVLGTSYAYLSDGAKRDRLVWSGDLWFAQGNMYAAFSPDSPYMPGSIRMLAENRTPDGYVQACPFPESHGPLPDGCYGPFASDEFAAWFVPVLADHVLHTGDINLAKEMRGVVRDLIAYLDSHTGKDGIFEQRIETCKHSCGLAVGGTSLHHRSYMNVLLWLCYNDAARLAGWCGDTAERNRFAALADRTARAVRNTFWNAKRGCLVLSREEPAKFGFEANALALAAKFATRDEAMSMLRLLRHNWHGKFQLLAVRGAFAYGQAEKAMELVAAHNWYALLNPGWKGCHTVQECCGLSTKGWGDEAHPDACIAGVFTENLLGVEPLEPGYRTFRVRPQPTKSVTSARGRVPTPFGPIDVSWRLGAGGIECEVNAPPGASRVED